MIQGLDTEAWDRWKAYRQAIKKPIKPASEHAMQLKLARYGDRQAESVDQSISNQWQGLFDPAEKKRAPGEKPVKTDKQVAADNARWEAEQDRNVRYWNSVIEGKLGKLRLADALLARYTVQQDVTGHDERIDWLKERVADLLREADAKEVVGDPSLQAMVRQLWGENGVRRLRSRAAA